MTEKEYKKATNDYWRFLRSALNVLYLNNVMTEHQYAVIQKKIDKQLRR